MNVKPPKPQMREECEECGEYKYCNHEGVCHDCEQDLQDLEALLPEESDEN